MRLKIVSTTETLDGHTWTRTRVLNVETGEELEGVTGVSWQRESVEDSPSAVVRLCDVDIDAEVTPPG